MSTDRPPLPQPGDAVWFWWPISQRIEHGTVLTRMGDGIDVRVWLNGEAHNAGELLISDEGRTWVRRRDQVNAMLTVRALTGPT